MKEGNTVIGKLLIEQRRIYIQLGNAKLYRTSPHGLPKTYKLTAKAIGEKHDRLKAIQLELLLLE